MKEKIKMPVTVEELTALQPNNVTFGSYDFSPIQEDVLTMISAALKDFMVKEIPIPKDLFNQPYVEISTKDIGGEKNKNHILEQVKHMIKKDFEFRWVHPEIHQTIETTGVIVSTVHSIKKSDRIVINFNPWVIPFLLYVGKGVGGTYYNVVDSLKLKSKYSKRLYKIISSQKDRAIYKYWISDVIKDFDLKNKKSLRQNADIKSKVFARAKKEIDSLGSNVTFDYEFEYIGEKIKGKKPKANCVKLKIYNSKRRKFKEEPVDIQNQYTHLMNVFYAIWTRVSDKPLKIVDEILNHNLITPIYFKVKSMEHDKEKSKSGEKLITNDWHHNKIKKMLREDYGIE